MTFFEMFSYGNCNAGDFTFVKASKETERWRGREEQKNSYKISHFSETVIQISQR